MKEQPILAVIVSVLPLLLSAQAGQSEIGASPAIPDTPETFSGLQHALSREGYSQFDYDKVDLEKLKKQGGKIY